MKKLLALVVLSVFFSAPTFAGEHCSCDTSCSKACAKGKVKTCQCEHADCKDCKCAQEQKGQK